MPGLTLEQLKKIGAQPKQDASGIKTNEQPQQDRSFSARISEDLSKRRENVASGIEAQSRGEQTIGETALQNVGQGVGLLFDVGAEAFKSVIDAIPDAIKVPAKEVGKSVLSSPIGRAGIKAVSEGVDAYEKWKSGNPRAARNLEATVNIASLFPIGGAGKVIGKEAVSIAGEGAGRIATKLETGLAKKSIDDALEVIKPKLTELEKSKALQSGRGVVEGKILPRTLEKVTLKPSPREIEIANTVSGIVDKSKSPIDNIQAINTEIGRVAESVQEGLKNNNAIFNKAQIKSVLNKAKDDSRVVFGGDKTLQNSYNAVVSEMMRQIENQPKNLAGLLKARKNFDTIIDLKFPNLLGNPVGDSARQNAVRDVRRAVNDFISDQLPDNNAFKADLRKQSLMYDAIENISKKAASAVDANIVQKVMRTLRQNPLTSFATGGILTSAALLGMFSNPVIIGTLVLGGSVKLGKTIVTSRTLRQSLIYTLRALEKAGKAADGRVIRDMIKRIPVENVSIGMSIKDVRKSGNDFVGFRDANAGSNPLYSPERVVLKKKIQVKTKNGQQKK